MMYVYMYVYGVGDFCLYVCIWCGRFLSVCMYMVWEIFVCMYVYGVGDFCLYVCIWCGRFLSVCMYMVWEIFVYMYVYGVGDFCHISYTNRRFDKFKLRC